MARGSTVQSSVPPPEEDIQDEELLAGDEEELEVDEEAERAALDEAAQAEGYESHAEKERYERLAYKQGWRPLAEYKGVAGKWKTAKQFVEDGNTFLPFVQKERDELRDQVTSMTREMEGMRTELATTRADMQKLLEFSRKADDRAYAKAVADLEAQARDAAAAGDVATYDQVQDQLGKMEEAREEAPEPTPTPPAPQPKQVKLEQATVDFLAANPWVTKDRTLNKAMVDMEVAVRNELPDLGTADVLQLAKERVMADYPEKFGRRRQATPPAGDPPPPAPRRPAGALPPSSSPAPRAQAGKTGFDSIVDPKERAQARIGYERAKASMPSLTVDEYLDIYSDPHGDVLDVRQRHKNPAR